MVIGNLAIRADAGPDLLTQENIIECLEDFLEMQREIHRNIHKKIFLTKKHRKEWLQLSSNEILALEVAIEAVKERRIT